MNTKEKIELFQSRIEVMQAYLNGKQIQLKSLTDYDCDVNEWEDVALKPRWHWEKYDYRVKPEDNTEVDEGEDVVLKPPYRPYKNADEMINDTQYKISVMQAFLDGKQIQIKYDKDLNIWDDWCFDATPSWDWLTRDYRVKPKQMKKRWELIKSDEDIKKLDIERSNYCRRHECGECKYIHGEASCFSQYLLDEVEV